MVGALLWSKEIRNEDVRDKMKRLFLIINSIYCEKRRRSRDDGIIMFSLIITIINYCKNWKRP